jgi:serine protein kinase
MPFTAESLFDSYKSDYENKNGEVLTLSEYLNRCKTDKMAYASPAERLLSAIGEPQIIETAKDARLSRIFQNRTITRYPAFNEFYGMEEAIMQIVGHLRHSAQGLEESKQILYLLGPVGSAKSSLAERIKSLMEEVPFYALQTDDGEISPIHENPLGLFDRGKHGALLQQEFGIDPRYLRPVASPWAVKKLKEFGGDLSRFRVVKVWPSIASQVAISKTEPGDENNQDISALVGKVDIRKLEDFSQADTDAYSYSGGLCTGNRGVMEFVEMFKAPIKVLHPLLTATQEGHFNGTEAIGAIPFEGIILAHSNESEWEAFIGNKQNEAFIDRVNVIRVPYSLQVSQEMEIYRKMIRQSELADRPCAPGTLEMLAQFSVLTRLRDPENSSIWSKMKIYDGENLKGKDPKAKSIVEYQEAAGPNEGMDGMSTRFAFKTLSKVYNFNAAQGGEIAANPIHLMYVLRQQIERLQLGKDRTERYLNFIKEHLERDYRDFIGKEIQRAYLESFKEYGQNMFERYVTYADYWMQDMEYRDPQTGALLDRPALEKELEKIEKPAGIANVKDFRNEIVNFVLRARALNAGKTPDWQSYEKMATVIEKKVFSSVDEILPIISFSAKATTEDERKHREFVDRMVDRGYTEGQVRLVTDWYTRHLKAA